jgi:hypothetical protein
MTTDLNVGLADMSLTELPICNQGSTINRRSPPHGQTDPPVSLGVDKGPMAVTLPEVPRVLPIRPSSALTSAILKTYKRTVHVGPVPDQLLLAANALVANLPSANEGVWRIETTSQTNVWPKVGERRTARLILWTWARADATPEWSGEIMIHLLVPGGVAETIAWRLGPGAGCDETGWDDWRVPHLVPYYALQVGGKTAGRRTESAEILRLQLRPGKSMLVASVVDLLYRGVRKTLGAPFEPRQEDLSKIMRHVAARLKAHGTDVGDLVVRRRYRKSERQRICLPSAFVEMRARNKGPMCRVEAADTIGTTHGRPAAVIIIDVFSHGGMKPMGAMFDGEEPMVHFFRSQYPPPKPSQVLQALSSQRHQRDHQACQGVSEGPMSGPVSTATDGCSAATG